MKADYDDLQVEYKHRRRSILVRFRDPVSPGADDFTVDVIVAVDCRPGDGLYIPKNDSWDRSLPEEHTRLILSAIEETNSVFARVVRLIKHWNKHHGSTLCSWNIKALALGCLTSPMTELEGLTAWFEYAAAELGDEDTPDPAGVASGPIKTNEPRAAVVKRLLTASRHLEAVAAHVRDKHPVQAHEQLSKWLGDEEVLPMPSAEALYDEVTSAGKLRTNVGLAVLTPAVPTQSWRDHG